MTNLDQHSDLYGTSFGVLGNLGGLLRRSEPSELLLVCYTGNCAASRRMRRRNRLHRQN